MIPRIYNISVKKWKSVKRHVERVIVGAIVVDRKSHSLTEPHNIHFKNLQRCFIIAFSLAAFADWLQGPYVYRLYKDYGYQDDSIAFLFIAGFMSSCIFGTIVGQLADRYGRKVLCSAFTVAYSLCCLTKLSSNFTLLLVGRILGGVSTSILFTTFEAWYVNEHLNFFKLPVEWLNSVFARATFYNGLSAIVAGVVAQIFAEYLDFGPVAPFIIAIPCLLSSLMVIQSTWKEHTALTSKPNQSIIKDIFQPLKLLTQNEFILFHLGLIQSIFESVMYTFVFSWTPILADLKPPLGLIFAIFMVFLMSGSKTYSWLVSKRFQPQNLLIFTCALTTFSFIIVTLCLSNMIVHVEDHDHDTSQMMSFMCLFAFLIYEWSVGLYYPAVGYLRSHLIPEEYRATLSNWFRVPMNLFTCATLTLKFGSNSDDVTGLKKFQFGFTLCSVMMLAAIGSAMVFSRKFSRRIIHNELAQLKTGDGATETI